MMLKGRELLHSLLVTLSFTIVFIEARSQQDSAHAVFHPDSIKRILGILSSDELKGRLTGSEEINIAAHFIAREFEKAGVSPVAGNRGYFSDFSFVSSSQQYIEGVNIVAALPGKSKKEELIIFCAHYDHVGTKATNPSEGFPQTALKDPEDSIYNGANDNGTGTTAVILLAKYFAQQAINERTILFITFAGEEFGLRGSYQFANTINAKAVKAVINIEMIGRGLSGKDAFPFHTGPKTNALVNIINKRLKKIPKDSLGRAMYFIKDPYPNESLLTRSDNFPFALKGIPACTLMSTPPNDIYYHSVKDEISTIDLKNMSTLIRAIALGSEGLVRGSDTPR